MKPVYSRRVLADLEAIATYYSTNASPAIAASIEHRFREVIDRVCRLPEAAPRVSQRSQVRVVTVVRYRFRISIEFAVTQSTFSTSGIRPASRSRDRLGLTFNPIIFLPFLPFCGA